MIMLKKIKLMISSTVGIIFLSATALILPTTALAHDDDYCYDTGNGFETCVYYHNVEWCNNWLCYDVVTLLRTETKRKQGEMMQ